MQLYNYRLALIFEIFTKKSFIIIILKLIYFGKIIIHFH